jgi:uncharacterized protein YkwD
MNLPLKIGAGALALLMFCAAPTYAAGCKSDTSEATMAQAQAQLNALRKANGKKPLGVSPKLTKAAVGHACAMATQGFFAHVAPNGSNLKSRIKAVRYNYCFGAENLAQGQQTLSAAMAAWMKSPGHRKNMLAGKADEFGFAEASSPTGPYWVLVFGRQC